MRYHCRDCSYRGKRLQASGSCPACGSFNMHMAGAAAPEVQAKPRRLQLAMLVLLWVVFAGLVLGKLVN